MWWLYGYYALLLGGLATMLLDGFGRVAFLVYYAGMPLGALAVWWLNGRRIGTLGWPATAGALRAGLWGAAGAAAAVGAVYAVLAAVGWAALGEPRPAFGRFLLVLSGQQVLVAGIEELAFRGVIQALLVDRLGLARGLGATAGLFGLFHLPNLIYQEVPAGLILVALFNLTVMGTVFGAAFERGGRQLALLFALHFGWNLAAYSFEDGFRLRLGGPAVIAGDPAWFPETGLAALLGLALAGTVAWVLTGARRQGQEGLEQDKRFA